MDELPIGTIKTHPNSVALPYEEYAIKMNLTGSRAWMLVNTDHGGGYSDGVEFTDWPVAYTPPVLFEE